MTEASDRVAMKAPRHLVVLANPSATSFDHAIVETYKEVAAENRQEVEVRDLYALQFDPALKAEERPAESGWMPGRDVAIELEHLRLADILVFVYPIWYGLPPAMLKGYVDRVLGAGYTFRDVRSRLGQPAVAGKPLLSFSTSALPLPWLHEQGQVLALREIFDAYLWQVLGMSRAEHVRIDSVVPDMPAHYAAEQLERVRETARTTCAMLRSDQYRSHGAAGVPPHEGA